MKQAELMATLKILYSVIHDKMPYKQADTQGSSGLTKEICFGVFRNFYSLENIANNFVSKKPKDMHLWLVILIGIYQLRFLNIPQYAVVKETVEILSKSWEKNFVNAVLRSYLRSDLHKDKNTHHELTTTANTNWNHPAWLIDSIKASWPNDWQKILVANNQHPPLSIRVNTQKISVNDYIKLLESAELPFLLCDFAPEGIIITKPVKVAELPGFTNGLVSVQDLAAQLAEQFLDLHQGFVVLDACAAPGGKTCHILEKHPNLNGYLALEISSKRAQKIYENLNRLNLKADVKICDCLEIDKWWDGKYFDRILLDAPCSATGVIRRNPDIKLLRTAEEITFITQIQGKLLAKLWQTLKPGGKLLYTTCSILPEENEQQITEFLKTHPDSKCLEIKFLNIYDTAKKTTDFSSLNNNRSKHGLQIFPGEHNMDGFFYSVLQKNEPGKSI